ncbi:hypothetical protein [Mesorhizobium sp.]|uniref:type II toxin-antitoxin system Phd/YefM family antitoxin n=1 Tax=Mesorhizobium sp. TaxID=1871066 RepID=UPI0025F3B8B1|nr:hypothetical protein [Mesorhizobium sp.]
MRIVNIHEAKTHLSRLVDKAAKGGLQPPIQRHRPSHLRHPRVCAASLRSLLA